MRLILTVAGKVVDELVEGVCSIACWPALSADKPTFRSRGSQQRISDDKTAQRRQREPQAYHVRNEVPQDLTKRGRLALSLRGTVGRHELCTASKACA